MGRTLAELQRDMSSQEFSLWLAMYDEDQLGEARKDLRAGVIAAAIGNYAGKTRKSDAKPLTPSDFFGTSAPKPQEEPDPVAFFTAVSKTAKFDKKGAKRAAT